MAFDAYLKLEGVDGEAKRKGFEEWIEILSFSFGASNPTTIGSGGGGGAGKVSLSPFNVMKKTDAASTALFQAVCNGSHFPKCKVALNKAGGGESVDYLVYEFEKVFIESFQWSGSSGGDDTPTESVALAFGKVSVTYTGQSDTGDRADPKVASWDAMLGTA